MDRMKLVDEKIKENHDIYERMDSDKDLVLLTDKTFVDGKGKNIEGLIHVIRNTPAWQAYVIINKLLKIKWQPIVESSVKLSKDRISDIECFTNDMWAQIDEFLSDSEAWSGGINAWIFDQLVKRGEAGARFWPYFDKEKNLVLDCQLVDIRWCPYELNEWHCNITSEQSSYLVKKFGEGKMKNAGVTLSGTLYEVRNFWDKDKEEIWVGGKKIDENENIFKIPPFVAVKASRGSTFRDSDYLKWTSESFLFLNRELFSKDDLIASISQTLSLGAYAPATEQVSDKIPLGTPAIPPATIGENIRTDVPHTAVPTGDLNNAYLKSEQSLNVDIQHSGVTEMGTGNSQAPDTAVMVTKNSELQREFLKADIDAMAAFRQKTTRLIFNMITKLPKDSAVKTAMGIQGMKHRYTPAMLGDPSTYRITYEPMMISREQNIANTATANAQRGILPEEFILRDTMQIRDIDGIQRQLRMQEARQADPTIGMIEMAVRYLDEAEDLKDDEADEARLMAWVLTENIITTRRAMMAPPQVPRASSQSPKMPEVKPNQQGLLALGGPDIVGRNGGNEARGEVSMPKIGE